ncbi:hypothetical protein MIMGU_mgv1a000797mg [Erythranthe guttata]|uniref:C3H1-type domain-containing protein n=1 Tax=Erythranthe guttata TaxID=4155 RepID=A0A022Q8Z2_ERYGU|nr:hypothetical protein MIMGU_mgv1a000797mg [Erythranthe guttata]
MENIETLLAAVAQTQGFDDDEPVVPTPPPPPPSRLVNFDSSPEIPGDLGDSQLVEAPVEVSRDLLRSTANRTPETAVPATDRVIGADDKKKRGRPPRGQLAVKPPPQKRAKQEDEDEDVCFICFDGGSLVLCDRRGCPKAYHPACIKRDEAFFKSKAKWNCGWHICSVCRKASHYVCYTCTYSLCKGCTKDADYVCVRGNKGFCSTCMKTITLMENQGPVNSDSGVQVDFDDVTSWEYLFKMYWVPLKEKLSLTMSDLTKARNPWKGVAPVVCTPQLSNVLDGKVSIPIKSSEHLEINKLEEAQNKTLMSAVSRASNHIEIPNSNSGENETIFSKDTKILNANETSIGGNCGKDTSNPVIKNEEDNLSIVKDRGEPRDGNPDNSAGFVDSVASGMEVDVDNSLMQIKSKEDGEKIDASVSDNAEKLIDQVNVTNSTIGGRNESNDQRSEMETSSATVSVRNFLPVNIIETEKLWHHRDHNGKIQGPFSMMHLRDSSKIGLFPHNMRIWTNHEQYDSLLLTDALSGRFHGASEWRHDRNDGDSKQKETASCNNATVLPDNNSGSVRANESPSWPQCWDLLKDDEVSNGPQNTEKIPNLPNQNETTSGGNKSLQEKENPRPLPIDLSLNDIDIDSGCVSAPVSTNFPLQNSGILELLSPKDDHKATEKPPPGLPNFPVPNAGPSWTPEVANEWCGYASTPAKPCAADAWDSDLVSAPSQRPHEVTNWLAMMNEPIEFDALGEESVSDLLAEVDAMESQGVFPSPTSAMKFAKEMLDCRDDCFSSIEEFSSTNDVCKPVIASSSVIDGLDSFNNSSSVGSAVENNNSSSVYTGGTGSDFHQETADPGWGAVQGNINLVTVQGNVNLVLGGPSAQGMANMGWGNPYQTAGWGNPNLNQSPVNGNLPWEGPRKYGGERFPSPREWGGCYQGGGEPGFGRGRLPWGRPPFSGGGGGGYSRPPPKGQRICKFYESGRCKKGAFCDYLHPS